MNTLVTLEQWQALVAVVDSGGYASAAESMDKSQSSISYAIQKLETSLSIQAFKIEGRKAVLTPAGRTLYRRAKVLLEEAQQMESMAQQFSSGIEAEIKIVVDTLFPEWVLLDAIQDFVSDHPMTRIELKETVLSGADEALINKEADIVICGYVPPGFLGDPLMQVTFRAVAAPNHPLHQLNRTLDYQDLRLHRQLVVKDSGSRGTDSGWLGAQQRLTLSHIGTSIRSAVMGLGYAWFPALKIKSELDSGQLKALPLASGSERLIELYLIYREGSYAGPATMQLGSLINKKVKKAYASPNSSIH
ncbi:LysR family transcriptional regulator [Neptunomonas sp.]|uniref:LysR family transcriptional regulator n=1 Tax=Neptunomonas sp. TaxID=1971898 RepID=UPI0025EF6733|nr:LysR family transcriptional regulator [Neptunomonas sp.]